MVKHQLIKLKPITPFHIGTLMDLENTEIIVHSDTIFSALCNILGKYFSENEYNKFIQPFINRKPPFLLSSAFPYYEKGENTIFFFPKPLIFKDFVGNEPNLAKKYKKIRYISKKLFDAYITGNDEFLEANFKDKNNNPIENNFLQGYQIWLSTEERELIPEINALWKVERFPRIVIDRITSLTGIYHYSRVFFHEKVDENENVGLFLLINVIDKNNQEDILNNLFLNFRYLGDTGLGGERSIGNGFFELQLDNDNNPFSIEIPDNSKNSKYGFNLSLYIPTKNELQNKVIDHNSYYQLIKRTGWISQKTYFRKSINLILEGSVLNKLNGNIMGKMVDVTPEILSKEDPTFKCYR
ncbi:MAG: type III-A CRISPR-associated RAMP protein Csm4, partial [Promethearchaeota archaeon]